jgi:hypothetical protein
VKVATHRTKAKERDEIATPAAIEGGVRQLLANKVSGTLVGLWLLIPELLRLGVWDLLSGWTGALTAELAPRLAMQLVTEAALCVGGVRERRCLSQRGFELANGLPFVATDEAIHCLLDERTVAESQALQVALGQVRSTLGHFPGRVLALDPHRMPSHSKRQMTRQRPKPELPAAKNAQAFFCLDTESQEPLCLTLGSSSLTVSSATGPLVDMTAQILHGQDAQPLLVADTEHFTVDLVHALARDPRFDLLVPMPNQPFYRTAMRQTPEEAFVHRWAGIATAKLLFSFRGGPASRDPLWQFIQRSGETPGQYRYRGFVCTADRDEVDSLTLDYPARWHVEEFFNREQDMGWKKAGTLNQNIRYGRMSLALIAQAACSGLRRHLGEPFAGRTALQLANTLFRGLDGDIRVRGDRIVVTYYNAPSVDRLRGHYEDLPQKLEAQGIDPAVPWLYDFKLDFQFK